MNEKNLGESVNTAGIVERTDPNKESSPVAHSDSFANPVPADKEIVHETQAAVQEAASSTGLFNIEEVEQLRKLWNEVQVRFVDEPRAAVEQADMLVSEVIKEITKMFADEHSSLERQWNQGTEVSTEELRQALQHYRSFFNRLVLKNEE
jgi:hypothetical protein